MAISRREQTDAVQEQYDRLAADYDARWDVYVRRTVEETLRRMPELRQGETILDLGCGTGALLKRMSQTARLVGVDLSLAMLSLAQEELSSSAKLTAADAVSLPFADASFHGVVSSSSFHYWTNPAAGLREITRCLKPGGWIVITDWCDDFLVCRVCDLWLRWRDPAHRRTYGRAELSQFLRESGFVDVEIDTYRITWVWGLMTAVATTGSN